MRLAVPHRREDRKASERRRCLCCIVKGEQKFAGRMRARRELQAERRARAKGCRLRRDYQVVRQQREAGQKPGVVCVWGEGVRRKRGDSRQDGQVQAGPESHQPLRNSGQWKPLGF